MASYPVDIIQQGGKKICVPPEFQTTTNNEIIFKVNNLSVDVYFDEDSHCHMTRLHPPTPMFSLDPQNDKMKFMVGTGSSCRIKGYLDRRPGPGIVPDVEIDINP